MSRRFIAIVQHAGRTPEGLIQKIERDLIMANVYKQGGLAIFSDENLIRVGKAGVIIGTLFSRCDNTRIVSFDKNEEGPFLEGVGPNLIKRYWGGYIALLRWGEKSCAIRDPSGTVECYYLDCADFSIIASDVPTLYNAVACQPSIDWRYLHLRLRCRISGGERTALQGVRELLPGFSAIFPTVHKASTLTEAVWSPWDYARSKLKVSDDELPALVRDTTLSCVKSWSSRFKKVTIGASGGIDSSIVATGISQTTTQLFPYTMYTKDPSGDERKYARVLSNHLGIPLRECLYKVNDVDVLCQDRAYLPRPSEHLAVLALRKEQRRMEANYAVDAHFTGQGGDAIFGSLNSAAPIVDQFLTEGCGFGIWRSIVDLTSVTGASALEIARLAIAHAFVRRQYRPKFHPNPFVLGEGRGLDSIYSESNWLTSPPGVGPGSARHVGMLASSTFGMRSDPSSECAPEIHPLLSQPLTELCLSIPSWKWFGGGINRSIARTGFQDLLPAEIINRTVKAGPSSFTNELFEANRSLILEIILSGELVKMGLVARDAVEVAFNSNGPLHRMQQLQLLDIASTEVWASRWSRA